MEEVYVPRSVWGHPFCRFPESGAFWRTLVSVWKGPPLFQTDLDIRTLNYLTHSFLLSSSLSSTHPRICGWATNCWHETDEQAQSGFNSVPMQWVPQNMISECSDGCSVHIWSSVSVASTSGDSNNYSWKVFSRMAISQCYMYYNDCLEDVGQRLNLGSWEYRTWTWIAELQSSPSLCLIYFV